MLLLPVNIRDLYGCYPKENLLCWNQQEAASGTSIRNWRRSDMLTIVWSENEHARAEEEEKNTTLLVLRPW